MSATLTTLAETLAQRAAATPTRRAFTFLLDGELEQETRTYAELHARALAVASRLREHVAPGERVLLLLPPGLAYLEAVFGCFYAGTVGVSAAPPQPRRLHRTLPRLLAVAADAQIDAVLVTPEIRDAARPVLTEGPLARAAWCTVPSGTPPPSDENPSPAAPDALAFLQYTSGSTAQPRGVMLSHANLAANLDLIAERFGVEDATARGGSLLVWLPPYHDMGLIGGLLQSVHSGFPVVLMSPIAVIKRPERWLQAISRHRATHSGGPNFSYDLCVRRVEPAVRERLDLSCWETAFNGAEPIRATTIESFSDTFAPCGFRRRAFLTCYGLAEATLLVTGTQREQGPTLARFDHAALEAGRLEPAAAGRPSTALVGCGEPSQDHELAIVDPVTRRRLPDGAIGEIWIAGPSVARGYWDDEAATEATFDGRLADSPEGPPFLRSGDLGGLHDGELFVTGRIKELLILRGRNLHPHDLETAAEAAHHALRAHCGAAFALESEGEPQVALVLEVDADPELDAGAVVQAVRRRIATELDVQAHRVVLVAPGSVPKTTSGKIQRLLTRELLEAGELKPLESWCMEARG